MIKLSKGSRRLSVSIDMSVCFRPLSSVRFTTKAPASLVQLENIETVQLQ